MYRPARQLKGLLVRGTDGDVGRVKDLYFDTLRWKVRYFVVETGTWLRHRLVLLSPESVQAPTADAKRIEFLPIAPGQGQRK